MGDVLCLDEDSAPSSSTQHSNSSYVTNSEDTSNKYEGFLSVLDNDDDNPFTNFKEYYSAKSRASPRPSELLEEQITKSLGRLRTDPQSPIKNSSDSEECYRKRARVGNHYQARIPKYTLGKVLECSECDELLWNPFIIDSESVETFLEKISTASNKVLLPMGNHLRDDEEALYVLQKSKHDTENAFKVLTNNHHHYQTTTTASNKMSVWSEEECRNFERGLLNFGKNFSLIQKYSVTTRHVGELVQFYYLWKKTERYDLFAQRMRSGKKKYALNPGISDLMVRYVGKGTRPSPPPPLPPPTHVQFIVNDNIKDVLENNSQY